MDPLQLSRALLVTNEKTEALELRMPYRCDGCGYEAVAQVVGYGFGQGQSFLVVSPEARHVAAQRAWKGAHADGVAILALVACPACGFRRPEVVSAFRRGTWIARTMVGTLFVVVGASIWRGSPDNIGIALLCTLIPGAAVMFLVGYIRELRSEVPAQRVKFLSLAEGAALDEAEERAREDAEEEERPQRRNRPRRRKRTRNSEASD